MALHQQNAGDGGAWLEEHASSLHQLAHDAGLAVGLVDTAAALVLMGLDDDEIYDQLRARVIFPDGQQNPLAGAPHVVHEIRRLVAVTTEEGE